MDASKLEGLGEMVDEIDAEGPPTPEQQEAQAVEEAGERTAREWGSIVFMVGQAAAMIAPELRQVYSEEACLNWGRAMNPVADKYGWNGPSGVPELGLLIATAGLVVPSVFAIKARMAALKDAPPEKAGWLGSLRDWWRKRGAKPAATPAVPVQAEVPNGV